MKLPRLAHASARPTPLQGVLAGPGRVLPSSKGYSIAFSKGWDHYAESGDTEKTITPIVEYAINDSSSYLHGYMSNGCDLYVRTGFHTSKSDSKSHVQVIGGTSTSPYYSSTCPRITCHIYKDGSSQCWSGWPK